eukprot:COSAG04_NODE_2385_length_4229_cov_1.507748_7_plen_161_part_00
MPHIFGSGVQDRSCGRGEGSPPAASPAAAPRSRRRPPGDPRAWRRRDAQPSPLQYHFLYTHANSCNSGSMHRAPIFRRGYRTVGAAAIVATSQLAAKELVKVVKDGGATRRLRLRAAERERARARERAPEREDSHCVACEMRGGKVGIWCPPPHKLPVPP